MPSTQTYIELSPTRICVFRPGRSGGSAMLRLEPAQWDRIWNAGPQHFTDLVRPLILEAGCENTRATVFYQSPSLVCGLFSCPAQVRDVTSAARMALADIATMDLTINPWSVQPIARDRKGEPRRRHMAIAADTDQAVSRLTEALTAAGLSGIEAVPMESALIARTVDHALENSTGGRAIVSLHFGQSRSVIIAAHNQRLLLARQVDFGTDRLTEALSHTFNDLTDSESRHQTAEAVLFQHGLPAPGQTIEIGSMTLGAGDILPAIQPVLQRMLVEVRQSVRFGLSDLEATPIVFLSGTGASIPRLADAFASELQLDCIADERIDVQMNSDLSNAHDAVQSGLRIRLMPHEELAVGSVRSLRNALYAGSAAALVLGAGHTAMVMQQTQQLQPQVDALRSTVSADRGPSLDPATVTGEVRSVRATIGAIDRTLGPGTDIGALLHELCTLSADMAILTDIEITGGHATECRVRGYTRGESIESAPTVRLLIDRLRESPLIESVRLEGTQSSVLDDQQTQYFSATLKLRSVPYPIISSPATVASAPTETLQ